MSDSKATLTRSEKREQERKQLEQEESMMLSKYQQQIAGYYMDQKKIVDEEREQRKELRVRYRQEAMVKKYKYRMAERHQNRNHSEVRDALYLYQ